MAGEPHASVPTGRGKLFLFIAGDSPNSSVALMNLRRILGERAQRERALEVVDVNEEPERALAWRVLVTPTLLWGNEPFGRRLIGDLRARRRTCPRS